MIGFPLLLIPLAIYNILVLLMPGVSFADPLVQLTLLSGAQWQVTLRDVLLALGVLMLLLEVFKGARPGGKYLTDHLLSLILFGAAAAQFLLWPKFGTSTYFLLASLALVDFLSGIALRAQLPRATGVFRRASGRTATPAADVPAARPAPAEPSAASLAESVRRDRPEPRAAQPAVSSSAAASPEIPSPGLQPGNGSHPSSDAPRP